MVWLPFSHLEDDLLMIKGERKKEKEEKSKQYHTIERRSGSFYRAVRFPVEAEIDRSEASLKDGVLTLKLLTKRKISKIEIN